MARLLGEMAELGYGVAYRVLDARHFGVPQRRRRVFILGLRSDPDDPTGRVAAERAAAVLAVGTRCDQHPATGGEAGPSVAAGAHVGTLDNSLGHHGGAWGDQAVAAGHVVANSLRASDGHHGWSSPRGDGGDNLLVSPSPDSGGVRAADGLAGRLDDRTELEVSPSLRARGNASHRPDTEAYAIRGGGVNDDPLLPLGLDSHRYRCCGNGVVANVAEWLGRRLP